MSGTSQRQGTRLARRTMITGVLGAGGGLALAGRAAARTGRPAPDYLDVSDAAVRARRNRIRITFDNTGGARGAEVQAVPLPLGTSRTGEVSFTVTSTTGRTTLSTGHARAQGARSVTASATRDDRAVVWVRATGYGPPLVPGDRLLVRTPEEELTVEVWIEPLGGEWVPFTLEGDRTDLGICAVHAALLRKGTGGTEVLMFSPPRVRDRNGTPSRNPKWDPSHPNDTNEWLWDARALNDVEVRAVDIDTGHVYDRVMKPAKYNIFCGGHAHMSDGRLFVAGGHITEHGSDGNQIHRYDPNAAEEGAGAWKVTGKLYVGRWYPTVTQLPDGRMLVCGGSYRSLLEVPEYWDSINNNYEVIDPERGVLLNEPSTSELIDVEAIRDVSLGGGPEARLATYPAVFVLPGERNDETVVALVETNRAWLYEYTSNRFLDRKGSFYRMRTSGSRSYPHYGPMVLLPLEVGGKTARILALGGQHEATPLAEHQLLKPYQATTATAEVLDLDMETYLDQQPGWRYVGKLDQARFLCDATLLADGKVLVSGGSKQGWTDQNTGWIYQAELFDPSTEVFSPAASGPVDRRYHSVALLLPDGSVLKTGSTGGFATNEADAKKWFRARMNAERYLPPYFWRDDRPVIGDVTAHEEPGVGQTLRYGEAFEVTASGTGFDGGTIRVGLIRLGSMTHGNNMDQRYVWLEVVEKVSLGEGVWTLQPKVPDNPAAAPPGDYMLVVVDENDVPSEAELVRVRHG